MYVILVPTGDGRYGFVHSIPDAVAFRAWSARKFSAQPEAVMFADAMEARGIVARVDSEAVAEAESDWSRHYRPGDPEPPKPARKSRRKGR